MGTGAALPARPVTNALLCTLLDRASNGEISAFIGVLAGQMGIESRHFCRDFVDKREVPRPGDSNPELAAVAIKAALLDADLDVSDIDVLIAHTTTPHTLLPPNISWVADHLGFDGQYIELRQACTGFANALSIAHGLLQSGSSRTVAIVGSETGSVFLDIDAAVRERSHLVSLAQMGDGAGAIVLSRHETTGRAFIDHIYFGNSGLGKASAFSLSAGSSSQPFEDRDTFLGFRNDYKLARRSGGDLFRRSFDLLVDLGADPASARYIVPHQANGLMPKILSPVLGVPEARIHNTAIRFGNTGSAASWIALHNIRSGKSLNSGDIVAFLGAEATKFLYGGFVYTEGRVHEPGQAQRRDSESA